MPHRKPYRRVGPIITPTLVTRLHDIPHKARPFVSGELFKASKKPRGGASAKAKKIRTAYVGEAYNLDLERAVEHEAAGKRSAFRATVLHAENWSRTVFVRVTGRPHGAKVLYRHKKYLPKRPGETVRRKNPLAGRFVSGAKVARAIRDRRRREEVTLIRTMHDMSAKEAKALRTKNRAEFDFLLTWGQYDRGDVKKGKGR